MRCSRFAYTLVTVVIAVGTIGIASASSRTGVAAEFGANPIFWQTANRFESVKDWRTFKIMEELVNVQAKSSFLLPLPYKIMISQARNYVSKSNSVIDGESINLKSIFSSKMLTLLSSRWDDNASSAVESIAVDVGNFKRGMNGNTENSSTSASNAANYFGNSSISDWLRGGWSIPKLSNTYNFGDYIGDRSPNTNWIPAEENEKAFPIATPVKSILGGESDTGNNDNLQQRFDSSSFFSNYIDDFVFVYGEVVKKWEWLQTHLRKISQKTAIVRWLSQCFYNRGENIDSKYCPQFNGSFGYPFHAKTNWTNSNGGEDNRVASWQTNLDLILTDLFGNEGYAEEQYSVRYGNSVMEINQSEEQATPPQSQGDVNCGYCNLATYLSIYYYGSNNTIGSTKSENCWENMAFINSNVPVQIGSETMVFNNSTAVASILGGGFDHSVIQNVLPIETYFINSINLNPAKDSTSAKTTSSGALIVQLVNCFKLEANKWTGAIKHIVVQFSILRDVF